ncbi:hypothetical protein FBR04_00270 [Betaproteobacteria bacterium PRO7]|jgi:hypothetical protein|nr:hypothetical protein [Betaproteobacteria bacterium PRO7]
MGPADSAGSLRSRIAVDIGSTVIKIARVQADGGLQEQTLHGRDFDAGIARQVEGLLDALGVVRDDDVLVCSSANGGLRVGIVSLTPLFSGAALRNQVLLAGGNPLFVHDLDEAPSSVPAVDILLVGGGIDCDDADPLRDRLNRFDHRRYRYGTLVYAGNAALADDFVRTHPGAAVIPNPLRDGLAGRNPTVFEALRRAYLDDLVHKEGISELRSSLARGIRPTPEVVSRGFLRALQNRSSIKIAGACILMDIGGATTDFHYTVEIVSDDSEQRPFEGSSVARYVFVDLGVVASRESTLLQLRTHPRLYEFLARTVSGDVQDAYRLLREGEYAPSSALLSYACVFLGLDRFAQGHGPGLPKASLGKVAELILSGGAAQMLDPEVVLRLFALLAPTARPEVLIDRRYQVWVDGITWTDDAPR